MKNVFKVTKYTSKIAQASGEPISVGIGLLTEIGSDIALSHISQREKNRLESSTCAIAKKISQKLESGDIPNDLSMVNYREPIINELLAHTLTKCRDEPEEKKNHFTENIFVNILFNKKEFLYDYQWGHSIIKDIERLTYNQILLFRLVCSQTTLITTANEGNYEEYISIYQTPFGVESDRDKFYESNQQLILNDFHTLYDMQYLMGLKSVGDLHIQKGKRSNDRFPFFCGVMPSIVKGLRIQELLFSNTNIPDYLQQDIAKLYSIIFIEEKLDNYIEKYLPNRGGEVPTF